MRVTFLLPNIQLRGGVRGVLDYSDLLAGDGVDVTVVFPTRLRRLPWALNEIEYLWRAPYKLLFRRWFMTRARLLPIPSLEPRYIPRGDVLVATAWQTAECAARCPSTCGEPFYFIQDIETYEGSEGAAGTYRLPFRRIVTTPWIRDELGRRFGASIHAMVPYGLDLSLYRPRGAHSPETPLAIGTLYDKARRKGFDIALRLVERQRATRPDITLRVIGVPRHPPKLPPFVVPSWRVPPDQTPGFYHSCHVWLGASRSEGFYLPGMEAMACGCAVVTTRVGGTVYYAIPERTALVCDPGDEGTLDAALTRVIEDAALRQRLGNEGARYVRRCDRMDSMRNMRRAFNGERVFIEPDTGLVATHCD